MVFCVTVPYCGGPLDGRSEREYAPVDELERLLSESYVFDWTPASIESGAKDVIERYRLEKRPGGWVFQYAGQVERPVLERNITATFVGGPRDGETTEFLGSIRTRLELAMALFPGYALHHEGGDDPLAGWKMRPVL